MVLLTVWGLRHLCLAVFEQAAQYLYFFQDLFLTVDVQAVAEFALVRLSSIPTIANLVCHFGGFSGLLIGQYKNYEESIKGPSMHFYLTEGVGTCSTGHRVKWQTLDSSAVYHTVNTKTTFHAHIHT